MADLQALRDKCKEIRREQGYSLQHIVDETGVSKATVDRFFGNSERGFQYETVKPIIRYLMQFDMPAHEVDVPLSKPDMIEMYRNIIAIKDKSIDYLKDQVLYERTHLAEMKRARNLFRVLFIATLIILLVMVYMFTDAMIGTFGMIRH